MNDLRQDVVKKKNEIQPKR